MATLEARPGRLLLAVALAVCSIPELLTAQSSVPLWLTNDLVAGSRAEWLLMDRAVSGTGLSVSIRPLSAPVADSLWALAGGDSAASVVRPVTLSLSRSWISLWFNSGSASSDFAGPVWAGRGLTLAASAGAKGRTGVLSWSLRPVAYWSENRPYTPLDNVGNRADSQSPWLAGQIDLPYRFGSRGYGRVDAGESFVRMDSRWVAAGISNAAQVWGPVRLQPLLLSSNAGGFPHAFLETTVPPSIGIGRVALRWMAGQLAPSPYSPPHAGTHERALIGAVGVFMPRGLDGLELGAGRLFHQINSSVAYDFQSLTLPIQALLKNDVRLTSDPRRETNQLASVFARLAPARGPIELYGEYLREDHNADLRDLVVEPDHDAAFVLGLRWRSASTGSRYRTITIENVNAQMSHLARVREQAPPYVHSRIVEGHTERGLLLGSPAALGGGGLQVRVEEIRANDAWWVDAAVKRLAQDAEGGVFQGETTGEYRVEYGRTFRTGARVWDASMLCQIPFGHANTTNVQIRIASSTIPR